MSQNSILLEAGTNELEIVEFYIDEPDYRGYYGVNVAKVLEILRMQPATSMPGMQHPAVIGAFPHRDGKIVPLVDLARYLDKESRITENSKVIVTEFNNVMSGFAVSGVNRIHRIGWNEVETPGEFLQNASRSSVTGVVRLEGRVCFILDLESLVAELDPSLSIHLSGQSQEDQGRNTVYTVLHADDSSNIRSLVKSLMEESGRFSLIQAVSGEEAWQILERIKEDCRQRGASVLTSVQAVITDIEMPRMDGLTLCRKIKEDPDLKDLPVALFSSLITDKLIHKGTSVGANAQFAKPDLRELSDRMLGLLSQQSL